MARTPVLSFDPLPPSDSISSYSRPPRPRHESDQNVLHALFRSLFPNYAVEDAQRQSVPGVIQQQQQQQEPLRGQQQIAQLDAAAAAAPAENHETDRSTVDSQDFRRSVTSLLDAMRDLLTNLHLPDTEQDGDADDSDENSED